MLDIFAADEKRWENKQKSKRNKLAIECIKKRIQKICFDANLYERGLCDNQIAENKWKEVQKLRAEIQRLTDTQSPTVGKR